MKGTTIVNIIIAVIMTAMILGGGDIGYWAFIGICAFFAVRLIISAVKSCDRYFRSRIKPKREFLLKMTARFMGMFFLMGVVLFVITLHHIAIIGGEKYSNAEIIGRSAICSLDLFMLDVDSNILDSLKDNALLKCLIIVQAALSFCCTIVLLASLVISRARAYYQLNHRTRITDGKNHLYLFFGLNDNSKYLAADIVRNDSKSIVIFIDKANITESDNDSWGNIVTLFTHRQNTFKIADKSQALVAVASTGIADMDNDDLNDEGADLLGILGVVKIRELIKSLTRYPDDALLNIFFFSEDEDENIRGIINLAKDTTIQHVAASGQVTHRIYCHARYNGPNKVIEDLAIRKRLNVEIVDSSHLAIELLKSRPECQPVNVARFHDRKSMFVTRPLNALIVGFGEVGRDVFRFIYEFGTFIDRDNDGKYKEINPCITAIDRRMDELDGLFRVNLPNIRFDANHCHLYELDYHNYSFYSKELSEYRCKTLDYIVIALGNDDENISLASAIFNRIRQYRDDMSDLIIMVRCVSADKYELMQKVASHYNQGCGIGRHEVIQLYGNPKDIYSYATIVRDDLSRKGKMFQESYRRLRNDNETWLQRRNRLTGMRDAKPGQPVIPDIDKLRKLRRQESQDFANALHAFTKVYLLHKALDSDVFDMKNFAGRLFNFGMNSTMTGRGAAISYPMLTPEENEVILHLAVLEHARWNAAHSLMGYTPDEIGDGCDERRRSHNCLVPWHRLDIVSKNSGDPPYDYKSYDFSVIETTIAIETTNQ